MGRHKRSIPYIRLEVRLDQHVYEELARRNADPTNKWTGIKLGSASKLINSLLLKYFEQNPAVTIHQLENPGQ